MSSLRWLLAAVLALGPTIITGQPDNATHDICTSISPHFDVDSIVSSQWRIYYSWTLNLTDKCLDMKFQHATQPIVSRFKEDMEDYLITQPNWDAAVLHMTMARPTHEMLLITEQGPAGTLIGVPNVLRDRDIMPLKKSVPLMKFLLTLLEEEKYLLLVECRTDTLETVAPAASLAGRVEDTPNAAEVMLTASHFKQLGGLKGNLTCGGL